VDTWEIIPPKLEMVKFETLSSNSYLFTHTNRSNSKSSIGLPHHYPILPTVPVFPQLSPKMRALPTNFGKINDVTHKNVNKPHVRFDLEKVILYQSGTRSMWA